jgi:DNA-directed RNA polymerase subunit alpha
MDMASAVPFKQRYEVDAITKNYGRFILGPLKQGLGITIGNAMRRILISSLPGAAVTSIRVSDVPHEFSVIPHVREDMTQFIRQVKKLRINLRHNLESARLRLEVREEGTVTAADIQCPADVEIENADLYLFTVDSRNAQVEIEFEVRMGRGFSPSDERGRLPIGELPVDAIFSPIERANFQVQPIYTAQSKAPLDRLILEVWTDGTIRPEEAIQQSAQTLMRHLMVIAGAEELLPDSFNAEGHAVVSESGNPPVLYEKPIEELDLSVRVFNSLKRTGITTIGDVLDMLARGTDAMLQIRNFGEKSLDELTEKLKGKGYIPNDDASE